MLKYPKKSHRKPIKIPNKSVILAELFGIIFGDGGISSDRQLTITLNSEADSYYAPYVVSLLEKLFKINVRIWKRPGEKTLRLVCSSTSLVEFLVRNGMVKGNKVKQGFDIPRWIKGNLGFERAFVRGLVDTDGCFYTHRHVVCNKEYYNLGFCFASFSQKLVESVARILCENGIEPHFANKGRWICLYSNKAQQTYLRVFGSSNPRIFEKYNRWKFWRGVRVV